MRRVRFFLFIFVLWGIDKVKSFAPPVRTAIGTKGLASQTHGLGHVSVALQAKDGIDDDNSSLNEWEEEEEEKVGLLESIRRWFRSDEGREEVETYVVSLAVALIIRFLVIEPRYIPSLSMYPTFEVGDQLAVEKVTKLVRPPNRNEVVVFNPPQTFRDIIEGQFNGDASNKKAREALIKRIVAVEVRRIFMWTSCHRNLSRSFYREISWK